MKAELSKYLHAVFVAVVYSLYDALTSGASGGHIALRALLLAVLVRVLGYAVKELGPDATP